MVYEENMKKIIAIGIIGMFLLVSISVMPTKGLETTPIASIQTKAITKTVKNFILTSRETVLKNRYSALWGLSNSKSDENNWSPEDEGDHFPCGYELWCYHACLTLENGQRWDAAATFMYHMNRTKVGYSEGSSFCRIRHWDRQSGKYYDNAQNDEFPGAFHTEKNVVNLTYYNNSAQGLYPNYHLHFEDDINNTVTDLQCHAISSPCWLFEEPTNKTIPWGFSGTGKAYFIPVLEAVGNITINGTLYNVTGVAYYEHDFAYCQFSNPLAVYSLREFLNATKLISSALRWWRSQVIQNRPGRTFSLHRSNDYLFGWCWSWTVFDNGCSLVVFRPAILRIAEGLVPALLYFSEDGQNYLEIGCVYWKNNRVKYIERADSYIPLDFEITAYKEDIKLHVTFNSTTEMTEGYTPPDFDPSKKSGVCTFYCCGTTEGYFTDEENNISLEGAYATEQFRFVPKGKMHRSLSIELLLPPQGLGISIRRVSHGIERYLEIQLKPVFKFIFYIKPAP